MAMTGPSISRRVVNFTVAAIQHICNGCPTAPQHVIDERAAQCDTCMFIDRNRMVCTHEVCGCNINTKSWLHKLGWADQRCPIGRWERCNK